VIRVLIAEDQGLVRGALSALLALESDIEIVGQAADGEEALLLASSLQPDIALLDIEMPKMSGLEVVQHLSKSLPNCRSIIVTTFARPGYLQRALRSGANGYLLKDARVEELADAIREVHKGGKVINQALMVEAWSVDNPLSEREVQILQEATRGLTTREIARQLYLSEGTVRNYLSEIMSKLDVTTRQEAIKIAVEKGWL
jgi:two-component system, NarL family, response regulator DesR